ncbi:MAG: ABC transporter ATP-binding protein [Bacillota bacterium]
MQLRINNLTFSYNKKEEVITDFNLAVQKGEVVALVGPSGSGKSTVLRLTAGLEIPRSGRIEIAGKTMVDKNIFVPPEKREVGMVFQDYALFPHLNVYQNISFGIDHLPKKQRQARTSELLELINLAGFEKRYPHQLSGGQQQRIALARTLAPGPKLLLLDEPFSNLDTELRDKIRLELNEIIKEVGITTILVSHDKEDAEFMADKEIIMNPAA